MREKSTLSINRGPSMSPVDYLCLIFGGTTQVAFTLGISKSAVSQWKTNGKVPDRHAVKILDVAKSRGLDITLGDIVKGRAIA